MRRQTPLLRQAPAPLAGPQLPGCRAARQLGLPAAEPDERPQAQARAAAQHGLHGRRPGSRKPTPGSPASDRHRAGAGPGRAARPGPSRPGSAPPGGRARARPAAAAAARGGPAAPVPGGAVPRAGAGQHTQRVSARPRAPAPWTPVLPSRALNRPEHPRGSKQERQELRPGTHSFGPLG